MAKFLSDEEMEIASPSNGAKFLSDDDMDTHEKLTANKYSAADSTLMGSLQGAAGGFLDELSGAGEAAGRLVGVKGLSRPFGEQSLDASDFGNTDFEANYKEGRDFKRNLLAEQKKEDPWAAGLGEVGGAIVSPLNKLAKGMSLAKGGAVLGGVSGYGNSSSDTVLGDIADTAAGATTGAALGYGMQKGADKIAKWRGKAPNMSQEVNAAQEQVADASASGSANARAEISGGGGSAEILGETFSVKPPQSLDELRNWKPPQGAGELPAKARLGEIEQVVPDLQVKPLKYHYDMLENPKSMKALKLEFENLPTEDAQKIASYNQSMLDEAATKIDDTVKSLTGGEPKSLSDSGNDFISTVKDKYNAEKEILGPVFEQLKVSGGDINPVEARDLIQHIGSNSKIGKLLVQGADGRFTLAKNLSRSGVSDAEHSIISRVIDDLNDGMGFEEMQKARDFLRKAVDPTNPAATAEIQKVRSIMLGQMEEMAGSRGPEVASTFKKYAINERSRENIEKIIGGKIESLDAMFAANPDKVIQKIFSNPNYVQVVGEYVGPGKLNEMVGAYVNSGVKKAFSDTKGFQPHILQNWLKTNSQFLSKNVDPATLERLSALADHGYLAKRFADEVNPSGTAASILAAVKPGTLAAKVSQNGLYGTAVSETVGRVSSHLNQRQAVKSVNKMMGAPEKPSVRDYIMNKFGSKFSKLKPDMDAISTFGGAVNAAGQGREEMFKRDKPQDPDSLIRKTQGTKYADVLNKAKQRGGAAVGATNYILQSTSPEYRKMTLGSDQDLEDEDI